MSTSKDQKTYLQKYISGPSIDKKKKKKKEKKVIKGKGFVFHDFIVIWFPIRFRARIGQSLAIVMVMSLLYSKF